MSSSVQMQMQPVTTPRPQYTPYIPQTQSPAANNIPANAMPNGYDPPRYPLYKRRISPTPLLRPGTDQIDDQPWKYLGYRALAKWAGSSREALIVRRFNALNARVLLFMQDEIVRIEDDLEELDKWNMRPNAKVHNGTFAFEHEQERNDLLGLLTTKLKAYNDYLLSHRQLRAEAPASSRCVTNLRNWFHEGGILQTGSKENGAIAYEETRFVDTAGDLVSVVPTVKPPLRKFLDRYAAWHRLILCCWPFRAEPNEDHHYQSLYDSKTTRYHNDGYIDAMMTIIITTIGLAALIGSLWVLRTQGTESARLWTISGFLGGFTVFLSVVTVAKPFEALAAVAAVAAVLMVFMQLGPGSSNSSCACTS